MRTPKKRIPIPKGTAANILYESDRTCCVCTERGKEVQIHHIDENPSNNSEDNLAILCFDCHEKTQIKGGFGRKLDAGQVLKFKAEWIERVRKRREQADSMASLKTIETTYEVHFEDGVHADDVINRIEELDLDTLDYNYEHEKAQLEKYLHKIVDLKRTAYKYAQQELNKRATIFIVQACDEVISFYEEVLCELATFYPNNHFGDDPKKFFNEQIGIRASWHRAISEAYGSGMGGSMISIIVSNNVLEEADRMIIEMVSTLTEKYGINYNSWIAKWQKHKFKH